MDRQRSLENVARERSLWIEQLLNLILQVKKLPILFVNFVGGIKPIERFDAPANSLLHLCGRATFSLCVVETLDCATGDLTFTVEPN
jgi:hypothetical protein